jgi:pyruvate,water dikinase
VIVRMGETVGADRIGGKAAALARLSVAGFPVPEWFALTPEAYKKELQLAEELKRLGSGPYAVRSSAIDEDGKGHSFAGQLESYLYVPAAEVAARVAEVWSSGFSERVLAYRKEHGLGEPQGAPGVLIQRMIDPDAAGVAFSADPVSGARGTRVVSAVRGVGEKLVSGEADADTWRVSREGIVQERLLQEQQKPILMDEQAVEVAKLAARAETYFGAPQDIEWAIKDGRLYLLQSRPITSLAALADPDGERVIWDNSNITESYAGVTTPLTFSFARRAYEEVYRQFCLIMAVPHAKVEANARTFRNMLGLVRGRVYYNLNSWYRALALLPGFTLNRKFMEQMMGVREPMPEELVAELEKAGAGERLADAWNLVEMLVRLVANHVRIERRIRDFYVRLGEALADPDPPLGAQRLDELARGYRELERRLLTRWDAPLVNDFLAMIFYGTLRKLAASWCGDAEGTLQNDLLCGEGGMISAEPAKRVARLGEQARERPQLIDALEQGKPFDQHQEFSREYEAYLSKFGDRCMEELKLESATLHDDPSTLLRAVAQIARHPPRTGENIESRLRAEAEKKVKEKVQSNPVKRFLFQWVLANARARVRDRENLRFERTRLFGRVRRIFVEVGKRLAAEGRLEEARAVFYLEVEEILGYIEGTATATDLAAIADVRKREFQKLRDMPAPADRFETRGAVHQGNDFAGKSAESVSTGDSVKGIGCCPGVIRAQLRVVRDPNNASLRGGEILVAERTDPGWIMLFPVCSGLLVERGSLLSHSAIVAREMGIPAIVSIPGVMSWARDGEWVEMNGATGVARKIAAPAAGA